MNEQYINAVNILDFALQLMNYEQNLTQNDKQELLNELNDKANLLLSSIDQHLQDQDLRLKKIEEQQVEILNYLRGD